MYMKMRIIHREKKKNKDKCREGEMQREIFLEESHLDLKTIAVWVFPTILSYISGHIVQQMLFCCLQ